MFAKTFIFTAIALFALALAPSAAAQCVAPPADMVNWWTGDDNSFDTVGGNHGTLHNGATYGAGKVIRAFSLDGVDDYVEVPNDPAAAFNFTNSFSIDAWIYLDAQAPQFSPIVSKWNDLGVAKRSYFLAVDVLLTGAHRLRFDVSTNGLFGGANSDIRLSAATIPTGQWVHVAGVYNDSVSPSRLDVYVNGVLNNGPSTTEPFVSPVATNDEPVLIGAGDLGSDARDFFKGRIDEVELFDRALTAAEILSLYGAGAFGKIATISIDVKPGNGDEVDPINLGSQGTTPVAILSTETFDATTLNIASLRFAGASVNIKKNGQLHYSIEDVNGDGATDVMLHFPTKDLELTESSTEAALTGTTEAGRCITATDSIVIVP